MKRRKIYLALLLLSVLIILMTVLANYSVVEASKPFITDDLTQLPSVKAGLLLGVNKNDYFFNRIDAAVNLFRAGKIKYVIVSGDNSRQDYNEPFEMKAALMRQGVPDSAIYLDYAGFRTFDSVVRAEKIFGQSSFIVISQKFHNERAIYIARKLNIEAYGYNAKDVTAYNGFKTKLREVFARDKVFIDLFLGIEPKFLGNPVMIGQR